MNCLLNICVLTEVNGGWTHGFAFGTERDAYLFLFVKEDTQQ